MSHARKQNPIGYLGRVSGLVRPRRILGRPKAWAPMPAVALRERDRDVSREVDPIARAVAEVGPTMQSGLANLVGTRYWCPGRFRRARRAALRQGRIRRVGRTLLGRRLYGPA